MKKFVSLLLCTAVSAQLLPADKLQPVQSLFIKPSADGSTGDLYVAATEENGISNWLTDRPVNFLPSLGLQSASILPKLLQASLAAKGEDEETATPQKRAIITAQTEETSKPEEKVEDIPSLEAPEEIVQQEVTTEQPKQSLPQYLPYQYVYPNLGGAVNAQNANKKEAVVVQNAQTAQYWPSSAYSYSTYPYMTVDPRFWAWFQAAGAANQQNAAQATIAPVQAKKE